MSAPSPHFLLYSDVGVATRATDSPIASAEWRFVLQTEDGARRLEAHDAEPEADPYRLELLALVRGLEALDQPSRVTLVTRNLGLSRDLRFGLAHWRDNNWRWERFGRYVPIKDADLWQRVDQALQYHQLHCRVQRVDAAHRVQPHGSRQPARVRSRTPILRSLATIFGRPFQWCGRLVGWPIQLVLCSRPPEACAG